MEMGWWLISEYVLDPGWGIIQLIIVIQGFLVAFKLKSFHPQLPEDSGFWESWRLEDLKEKGSTKIAAVVMIIHHHQELTARPMMWSRATGERDKVAEAQLEWTAASRKRKFLIMCVYEKARNILKKVSINVSKMCRGS
jgi:hypothetical protein